MFLAPPPYAPIEHFSGKKERPAASLSAGPHTLMLVMSITPFKITAPQIPACQLRRSGSLVPVTARSACTSPR